MRGFRVKPGMTRLCKVIAQVKNSLEFGVKLFINPDDTLCEAHMEHMGTMFIVQNKTDFALNEKI